MTLWYVLVYPCGISQWTISSQKQSACFRLITCQTLGDPVLVIQRGVHDCDYNTCISCWPTGQTLERRDLEGQIVILFDSNRIYNMILSLIFPMFRMQFPPVTPKILRSKLRCYPQQHIHALVHRTWHTLFPKHQAPGTRHSISDPTYLFQNLAPRLGSRNLVHKPDSSSPVRATLVVPGNWIALENPSSWTSSPLQCLPSFCRYAYYMYRTSTEDPTMRFSDVFNNVVIESWPSQVQSSFSLSWPQAHLFSVLLALLRFASLTFASYFEKDTASCSPTVRCSLYYSLFPFFKMALSKARQELPLSVLLLLRLSEGTGRFQACYKGASATEAWCLHSCKARELVSSLTAAWTVSWSVKTLTRTVQTECMRVKRPSFCDQASWGSARALWIHGRAWRHPWFSANFP